MIGVNPISNPTVYRSVLMASVPSPGAIPRDGIEGFDIATDWEVKKGKGKDGASITPGGDPPLEGGFTYQLWRTGELEGEPNDFDLDAAFVTHLQTIKAAGGAIDIGHPLINDQGVVSVVIKKIGKLKEQAPGLWTRKIDLLQWMPEPKKAPATPAGSAAGDGTTPGGTPADAPPSKTATEKEFDDTLKEAQQ